MSYYKYEIAGTAADGMPWSCEGIVECANFSDGMQEAMRDSFTQLTGGRAVFGQPGVGCRGPYKVTRFLLIAQCHPPS